jgi:hypothetical protein
MESIKRRLLSQGEMDGACFLYAIANAFICLTGKRPQEGEWDNAIDQIPEDYQADFLKGGVGTGNCLEDEINLREIIEKILKSFAKSTKTAFKVKHHKKETRKVDVGKLINEKSVALFCFEDEHWVVGTVYDKNSKPPVLYLACSAQLIEEGNSNETCDPILRRPCNGLTKKAGLKCEETVFQITRTK